MRNEVAIGLLCVYVQRLFAKPKIFFSVLTEIKVVEVIVLVRKILFTVIFYIMNHLLSIIFVDSEILQSSRGTSCKNCLLLKNNIIF